MKDKYDNNKRKKITGLGALLVVSFLFLPKISYAENLTVPDQFLTLQQAVDSSIPGDTIFVGPGIYTGFGNSDIIVDGSFDLYIISTDGSGNTVIDCGGNGRGITFLNGGPARQVLKGFTIVNGYVSDNGGGILIDGTSPEISDCIIENNIADVSGGGIYASNSSFSLFDSRITANLSNGTDDNQGGGGIAVVNSSPIIDNCEISGNESMGLEGVKKYGGGGGILILGSSIDIPQITNCTITSNTSLNWTGGGMTVSMCSPVIFNCVIDNNTSSRHGHVPSLDNGGGITLYNSSPLIENCMIRKNVSYNSGGIECCYNSSPTIVNTFIQDNISDTDGGGLRVSENSHPVIVHCTIIGNHAGDVGGYGGGFRVNARSSVRMINSILWGNTRRNEPEQIYNCDGTISISYSDIEDGWSGTGNICSKPMFNSEYHLTIGSPCVDSGYVISSISEDIYGNPRPDSEGGKPDMGAEEFNKMQNIIINAAIGCNTQH